MKLFKRMIFCTIFNGCKKSFIIIFFATFNILDGGSKFFNKKPPSHNVLRIKVFIGEIFVVGIHHYLLSHKDVFELFESFDDR